MRSTESHLRIAEHGRTLLPQRGDPFGEVGLGHHAIEQHLGSGHRGADIIVEVGVELALRLPAVAAGDTSVARRPA